MPHPFKVHRTTAEGDVSVLHLEGFLDAHTAPVFEQAIQAELDANRARLVVDGEKLTYISSAGLGVFMGFIEQIREQGGDLKICGLSPKVRQIFEILGFQAIYDMVETVPEAVQRFASAPTREA
jgi:anti-sigma B factor antagonist